MKTGSVLALRRSPAVALLVLAGGSVVLSMLSWVSTSDAILRLDACLTLFRLLPMTCLLTVRVLARLSRAVSGVCGLSLEDRMLNSGGFSVWFAFGSCSLHAGKTVVKILSRLCDTEIDTCTYTSV